MGTCFGPTMSSFFGSARRASFSAWRCQNEHFSDFGNQLIMRDSAINLMIMEIN
jgi:hypothetical protein